MEIFPQPRDGFDELPDPALHQPPISGAISIPRPVSPVRIVVRPIIL